MSILQKLIRHIWSQGKCYYCFTFSEPFLEKNVLFSIFQRINRTLVPIPFIKWWEIQLWLIKTTCFTSLLPQIEPVIIRTFNFKFEKLLFPKLDKNINNKGKNNAFGFTCSEKG